MNPLDPTPSTLCKLGSIVVHALELASPNGHAFDKVALDALLKDPEVVEWMQGMTELAMLPVRRTK